MPGSVIVGSARTPIGKLSGALAGFTAMDLGGLAIKAALERAGDRRRAGRLRAHGPGAAGGRRARSPRARPRSKAGIPMTVPAMTINKVCLSGINAIYLADQMIQNGDAEVVVAGGMESMTQAPYLLPGARAGYRMGNNEVVDSMIHDGLWCAFDAVHMGAGTENYVGQVGGITREAQDEAAAKSHERAAAAQKEGRFADEITPVSIPQRKGDPIVVDSDEGVRPGTTPESLGGLRPAFSKDGTITAGNASQISDGGAAVIMTSQAKAEELGADAARRADRLRHGRRSRPVVCCTQPSRSIKRALEAIDMSVKDVDLFELNEAFAAVGIASMKDLGISDDIVNVNGGAIALGHPVGMSGTRVVLTIINELRRRGGGVGAAALCGGGGQGDAAIIRTL